MFRIIPIRISLLFILLGTLAAAQAQVIINEATSANASGLADWDDDHEDWIELLNVGAEAVELEGYGISDNPAEPYLWTLPAWTLEPGEFKILFASGKATALLEWHTNFKLDHAGELLRLTDPEGSLEDEFDLQPLIADVSMGRVGGGIFYFGEPTPGEPNTTTAYEGITPAPSFDPARGIFTGPVSVEISSEGDFLGTSDDGSIPLLATGDTLIVALIDTTTTLRARAFRDGWLPSRPATHSYVIDEPINLPVLCLTVDPPDLWDPVFGIYVMGDSAEASWPYYGANWWEDWEKFAHWEYMEPSGGGFHLDAGAKINGGWSRAQPQKAVRLVARDAYGESRVDYPLYPETGIGDYKRLILRNCGNDFPYAHIRDILAHSIAKDEDLEIMASRACMVFLNGVYWGYQNLRERIDGFYLQSHFGVDEDEVDLIEARNIALDGDNSHWNAFVEFIAMNDMSLPGNYEYIKTQMDVENFAVYNCYEIFLANTDWPDHNIKRWRPRSPGGRWRWIYFDLDLSLNAGSGIPSYDMLDMATNTDEEAYGNPYWSVVVLSRLLANEEFKHLFLNHYADRLNSVFLPSNLHAVMDSVQAAIAQEIPRHRNRWDSSQTWISRLNPIRDFINDRPDFAKANLMDHFALGDTLRLDLDIHPPGAGRIHLTALTVDSAWSGTHFTDMPVKLKAIPAEGYVFDAWSDPLLPITEQITVTLTGDSLLVAHFTEGVGGRAVINEINYKSSLGFDCGDWVEFHNPGGGDLDMSAWEFRDDDDAHVYVFPEGSVLEADSFLVLAADRQEFLECFPQADDLLAGEMGFGLGTEDMARLYNQLGELQDIVIYAAGGPWPPEPNGTGPTLELIDPTMDNLSADSWAASIAEHGTPGEVNSVSELVSVPESASPSALHMDSPHPNPFNPETEIRFSLPQAGHAELAIYDIRGRRLAQLISGPLEAGWHRETWDGRDGQGREVSTGIYLALLRSGGERTSGKLVLIK